MAYKTSHAADHDLIDIYVYGYLNFGETRAERYFTELHDCLAFLGEHPYVGVKRFEFDPPVRIHHHGRHLIIYEVRDDFVLIIRILHDSMDIEQHL